MKSFLAAAALLLFSLSSFAYTVTFKLDMNGMSGYGIPEVNGTFNNWCGNCLPMTDANNDGIWEATINLNAGFYEYKFSANNWASQETLAPGLPCTQTTGVFTNRTLNVSANTTLPTVSWGYCAGTTPAYFPVTFQVNMNGITGFTTPNVSGIFNNWCGNCAPMTDANNDGIWTTTINMSPGTTEYKFSYDSWAGQETLPVGASCTKTTGTFTNRIITVTEPVTLDAFCWGSCNTFTGIPGSTPSVSIAITAGGNPSCAGTEVAFTATVTNAPSQPFYQWKVNGVNAGSNASVFTSSNLTTGQSVTCEVTCGCNQTAPVTSNAIVATINPIVTPSVTISVSGDTTFCPGESRTCTVNSVNGGTSPVYQWKIDGVNVGSNSPTFTTPSLTAASVVTCQMTSNAQCVATPWNLTWSDEFSGTSLDATKWTPEIGNSGWGNNELQYYTGNPSNVQFGNDQLHIVARNDGVGAQQYTSARLITKNKFSVKYGRITGYIKLPLGQGIWPAFWMLGANIDQTPWPGCGEIDIMEHINNEMQIHGTAHWTNNGWTYKGNFIATDPTAFHEYSVEWDSLRIRFMLDGTIYHEHPISTANGSSEEFTKPFFILLNMAVGGNWPGYPNASTPFPATMDVDYVRVYDKGNSGMSNATSNSIHFIPGGTGQTWYQDADGDGFGNASVSQLACTAPSGYVSNATDCNDSQSGLITGTPTAINGPAGVCRNATGQVFTIPSVPGATSYQWTLPTGATGTSTTNSIILSFSSTYVTGNLCVKAISGCGAGASFCRSIVYYSAKPATPVSISGIANGACVSSSKTFTVAAVANATVYNWTVPANAVIQSGQGTTSITIGFLAGFTSGTLSVTAGNCAGNSTARTLTMTSATAIPTTITGSATAVCAGSTRTYTSSLVSGAESYSWVIPANATILSGQGTATISVQFPTPFTSGNVQVKSQTSCFTSAAKSLIVYAAPSSPASVSGLLQGVCNGTTQTYSCPVSTTGATSYNWTVPTGSVINSGQGTNSISLTVPASYTSGIISVAATNVCGTSALRSVTIRSVPVAATTITGNASNLCGGVTQNYSVVAVAGATGYNWTPATGCSILTNSGTSVSMQIPSAFTTGTLSVTAVNSCGSSPAKTLALTRLPATPGTIAGPTAVCPLQTGLGYSLVATSGLTYTWTLPGTGTVTSGQGTSAITANWGTTAGSVSVKANNACGSSSTRTLAVALNACRLAMEEEPTVDPTARIFPNPGTGLYQIETENLESDLTIAVYNMLGEKIGIQTVKSMSGSHSLDLRQQPAGIYFVKLSAAGFTKDVKIIKQ